LEVKLLPREKFHTLTEQMFYILLCLQEECCGIDIMERVKEITSGRVVLGPGTLYSLLSSFQESGMITETAADGRKRTYILSSKGRQTLTQEYERLKLMSIDYEKYNQVNG
jgi:DNA-binding PadR family transcriptional regulator